MKVSEYFSDDKQRYAAIFVRDSGYRIFMSDLYFETQKEVYETLLARAEIIAENYVMRQEYHGY